MRFVLVDTDIFIEVLRGRNPELAREWIALLEESTLLFYSPVTVAELIHGIEEDERPDLLLRFEQMTCAPLDREVGLQAGNYLQRFHPSHNLDIADALIAATAAVHGMRLWTRNRKHFPMSDVSFF
jgi:predicted nucleic acid-binding protein